MINEELMRKYVALGAVLGAMIESFETLYKSSPEFTNFVEKIKASTDLLESLNEKQTEVVRADFDKVPDTELELEVIGFLEPFACAMQEMTKQVVNGVKNANPEV